MKFWISLFLLLSLVQCSSKKNLAPDRNFYFEIINHSKTEDANKLALYIYDRISKKKYTITNHSGLNWPFYKELDPAEKIASDSLMPPHWYVHRMIPLKDRNEIKRDEFLVKIELLPKGDTLPNYSVKIYRMDSTGLSLSGESGIHYIDSSEMSSSPLVEVYLKSIIRYSFK